MNIEFTYKNLPAVGSICEVHRGNDKVYEECEILAHYSPCDDGDLVAVFSYKTHGGKSVDQRVGPCFRYKKTAEDIAEEERQKVCNDLHYLISGFGDSRASARRVYDAGYRKFEIVEDDV